MRGAIDIEGNLHQLLLSQARSYDDIGLQEWIHNGTYLSHDVINELAGLISNTVLRNIITDIKKACYFALIADETMDISRKEQLCVAVRWVGDRFDIFEDAIGLVQLDETNAECITAAIIDVLTRCNLDLSHCRGQAYDGAATMSGAYSGVATRVSVHEPRAFYVHCSAHNLNLCLQDVCKNSEPVKAALDFTAEVVNIIRISPKRLVAFETIQKSQPETDEASIPTRRTLKPLCPTRWTVRTAALQSVIDNYGCLQEELASLAMENTDAGRKCNGYANLMNSFNVFFGLKLSVLLFSAAEQTNISLQSKDISCQERNTAIKSLVSYLTRLRNDATFNSFYEGVVSTAQGLTDDPAIPRARKRPTRYEDGSTGCEFSSVALFFRQKYYEAIDAALQTLANRFETNEGQKVMTRIEAMLLRAASTSASTKNFDVEDRAVLLSYPEIDIGRLVTQMSLFSDYLKCLNEKHNQQVKEITKISTISSLLILEDGIVSRTMFSEICKLLHIYLTCPVSSATAERTFSTLRRLKTYLRASMTQKRLNNLLIAATHKERTDAINITELCQSFISLNSHRQEFFGSFCDD